MRILFLSRWFPYPPDNGSKIRVFSLLGGLCERHDVTLLSFVDPSEPPAQPPATGAAPVDIRTCAYREFAPTSSRALFGFVSGTPRYLIDTHNAEMESLIRDAVARTRFDLVIASQLPMAAYSEAFRGIPAIFEEAELGIYWPSDDPAGTAWSRARRRLTWAKHTRYMSRLLDRFMLCTVVSDIEQRLLAEAVPAYRAVHVVPNSVDGEWPANGGKERNSASLIFTGSLRYGPNHDGVSWFLNEIFPSVVARVPNVRLTITGDAGPRAPQPSANVVLTGRVPDVRGMLAASAVSIAPIRVGGGTRLKIVEAMAARTPVVATTKAVEGLDVRHEEHLLIADTPRAYADAVHRLLSDPAGAGEMAARAWALFRSRYDSRVVVPEFLRLVDQAAAA